MDIKVDKQNSFIYDKDNVAIDLKISILNHTITCSGNFSLKSVQMGGIIKKFENGEFILSKDTTNKIHILLDKELYEFKICSIQPKLYSVFN